MSPSRRRRVACFLAPSKSSIRYSRQGRSLSLRMSVSLSSGCLLPIWSLPSTSPRAPPPTTALLRWVGPKASLGWPNHLDPPELSQQMVLGAGTKGLALCWPDTLGVGPPPAGSNYAQPEAWVCSTPSSPTLSSPEPSAPKDDMAREPPRTSTSPSFAH